MSSFLKIIFHCLAFLQGFMRIQGDLQEDFGAFYRLFFERGQFALSVFS